MKKPLLLILMLSLQIILALAQTTFTRITDTTNAIINNPVLASYVGVTWVDFDNDGWLDLFVNQNGFYKNLGNGNFKLITNSNLPATFGLGNTWADYNNDGKIDCFVSGGRTRGSSLWTNNGDGTFTRNLSGPLADSLKLRAWGSAFGDFNSDGYVDLILAAPYGFASITDSNKLLINNGNSTFTRLDTSIIVRIGTGPYTVPTWSDYDQDGDMDLFIGSGPANGTVAPDFLYTNELKETGIPADFSRITGNTIGSDSIDGQIWNWIDYDSDGDLDGFVTNYLGTTTDGMPNNLYRNDHGVFTKMTQAQVGTIVSDHDLSLSNDWGDFDNDGDLDCFVTNDFTLVGNDRSKYYQNNGDGTFTEIPSMEAATDSGGHYGAANGDYDRDGDLDLYVATYGTGEGLYRNDLSNGNSWVELNLEGVISNRSALGARVKAKATIHGKAVWQMREVQAQNSFNSMNALLVHFGLAGAKKIDSLKIEWPSGIVDVFINVNANQFYNITEGEGISSGNTIATASLPTQLCPVENISVPFTTTGSFNKGNIFTAQLSDASGSFSNPKSIGKLKATISGTIDATISTDQSGDHYRIRVVASDPAVTGTDNGEDLILPGCQPPAGISAENVSSSDATISWTAQTCALSYRMEYRKQGTSEWTNLFAKSTSKKITGLASNTTYEFKVRTKCADDPRLMSPWSPVQRFTTLSSKSSLTGIVDALDIFPNPFVSSTTIRFTLAEDSKTTITLLDLQGRIIKTLADGVVTAGIHTINLAGNELSAGEYLIQLRSEKTLLIKKVIVE